MFENVRKILDEFENTYNNCVNTCCGNFTEDAKETFDYFSVNLAKALMKDECIPSVSVAKIILAAKDLSSEIIVKVQ